MSSKKAIALARETGARLHVFHLSKEGNTLNGLASYMRTIRAIYNRGIKAGIIEQDAYPFIHYQIKMTPTSKRALDISSIRKILNLKLKRCDPLFNYRNYFLISYMLYGMPFIDMAFLKIKDIADGRIKYQRKKTAKQYNIKLTEQVIELLSYYTLDKKPNDLKKIFKNKSLDNIFREITLKK